VARADSLGTDVTLSACIVSLTRCAIQQISEEDAMNLRKFITILVHALIGWALCAATMGIGMATTSLGNTLIIHAIGALIFFVVVSLIYFSKFNYTTPLQTALIFIGFVMIVDFFVVALLINKSLEMFASLLGTWIPFALIFTSTYVTGFFMKNTLCSTEA
jgi:hypothetical protein